MENLRNIRGHHDILKDGEHQGTLRNIRVPLGTWGAFGDRGGTLGTLGYTGTMILNYTADCNEMSISVIAVFVA